MTMKNKVLLAFAVASFSVPCSVLAQEAANVDAAEEVIGVDESQPPLVEFMWKDNTSNGPISGLDKLSFRLVNNSDERVTASASIVFLGAGVEVETSVGTSVLDAGKSASLQLPVSKFGAMSNELSFQAVGHVVVTLLDGQTKSYHSAPLFFHVDAKHKKATLYTEQQMVDEFNGGLVTGEDVEAFSQGSEFDVAGAVNVDFDSTTVSQIGVASDEELAEMEEASYSTGTAMETSALSATTLSITPIKICALWRTQFEDGDMGADYWEETSYHSRAASYAYAKIMSGSTTVWSGYLDDDGCTPVRYLTLGASYTFTQYSTVSDGDTTYYVKKPIYYMNGSIAGYLTGSATTSFVASELPLILFAPSTTGGWVNAIALAGWLLQTSDAGLDDGSFYIRVWVDCPGIAEASCLDPASGIVYISSNDISDKFSIGHEIGHQMQYSRIGAIGIDYSDDPSEWQCRCDHVDTSVTSNLHCLQSRKSIGTAVVEGFGYFFAAKVFNSETGSDCMMGYGKEVAIPNPLFPNNYSYATIYDPPVAIDCDAQKRWQEHWCDAADTGVEWDWMNFFWEWHTGGGSSSSNYADRASMSDIYYIINDMEDWDDVRGRAFSRFGSDLLDPQYRYFLDMADNYGVIQ
jgi:hypothetical protein